jgi:NADH oxidase (H2O-forming)
MRLPTADCRPNNKTQKQLNKNMDNKVLRITDDVQWIGVLDRDIVTFDVVMETKFGTTYNSYFINARKKAIVETTKEKFWEVYREKILSVCNPLEIEYIILNHTEPDHSGNLMNLMQIAPNATVVGSGNAIRYLGDLFEGEFRHRIVKDGDTLDLGDKTIRFIGAPNLHWPDSMYSYLEEDQILFTCDSFGAHFCDERMFDDEVGNYDDAFIYYFDVILKPFSKFMLKAIEKIASLDLKAICTGHGPILRKSFERIIRMTKELAEKHLALPEQYRVFIPYVSAYHKTSLLAEKIGEGIRSQGSEFSIDLVDIEKSSIGDLEMYLTRANGIIVGCPTINQNILLPVYKLFAMITPLRDKGKLAGAFGSYGWSGESMKMIPAFLSQLKLDIFGEGIFVKFTPSEEEVQKAYQYGEEFARALSSKISA